MSEFNTEYKKYIQSQQNFQTGSSNMSKAKKALNAKCIWDIQVGRPSNTQCKTEGQGILWTTDLHKIFYGLPTILTTVHSTEKTTDDNLPRSRKLYLHFRRLGVVALSSPELEEAVLDSAVLSLLGLFVSISSLSLTEIGWQNTSSFNRTHGPYKKVGIKFKHFSWNI